MFNLKPCQEKETQVLKIAEAEIPNKKRKSSIEIDAEAEIPSKKRKPSFEIKDLLEDLLPQLRCFNCKAEPSVSHRKRFKCFDHCHPLCEKCNQGNFFG